MALVMRRTIGSATRKAVMLAMADASNEDGCGIWKSADTLADQCEISKRTVLTTWGQLEEEGLIVRAGSRRVRGGEVIVWDIDVEKIRALPKAGFSFKKPDETISPGETDDINPVKLTTEPGETVSPNPSLTRPIEPSIARGVFDHYSKEASEVGWIQHAKFTAAIEKHVNARIAEYGAVNVKRFITALKGQSWTYKGFKGSPEFRASLVYICRPRTFAEHFDKLCPPEAAPTRRILDLHNGLTRENWWTAVQWFYDSDGQWDLDHISPPPGHPECLAPPDMLKELAR